MGWFRCTPSGKRAQDCRNGRAEWNRAHAHLPFRCSLRLAATIGGLLLCVTPAGAQLENETCGTLADLHPPHHAAMPPMPARVRALVHSDWAALDPEGPHLIESVSRLGELGDFAHARDTFAAHLSYTFGMLAAWGQPKEVCRAGLFHTAYSGDLFQFYVWDAAAAEQRAELHAIVGGESEYLTWLFGTVRRGRLLGLADVMRGAAPPVPLPDPIAGGGEGEVEVPHRLQGTINVTHSEVAKLMVITLADYLEQMVEVNGWRDHHQVEAPVSLYPGDGRPALALHWISAICRAIRPHLAAVPPVFDGCTATISRENETAARDAYWRVVMEEEDLSEAEQLALLADAVERNHFVGEPHLMLAQIHYRRGDYAPAAEHAALALDRFYALSTAWDKRRSFPAWVGFARLLALRAHRRQGGLSSLPISEHLPPTSAGLPLVSVRQVAREMDRLPNLARETGGASRARSFA